MPENGQTSSNLFLSLFCFGPGLHWYQRYRPLHITCLYTGPGRGKREELWSGTQSTHIYSTRFSSQFRNSNHLPLNETDIFKIWSESFEYPPISLISISRTFSDECVFFLTHQSYIFQWPAVNQDLGHLHHCYGAGHKVALDFPWKEEEIHGAK
jgi:hypothetical protein